jgi:hypothetical protein
MRNQASGRFARFQIKTNAGAKACQNKRPSGVLVHIVLVHIVLLILTCHNAAKKLNLKQGVRQQAHSDCIDTTQAAGA